VGFTLAKLPGAEKYDDIVVQGPLAQEGTQKNLALSFLARRIQDMGISWLINLVDQLAEDVSPDLAVDVLVFLRSVPEIRDWVNSQSTRVQQDYWGRISLSLPEIRDEKDFARIVDNILSAHRLEQALELARGDLNDNNPKGGVADYVRILEHPLVNASPEELERGLRHHSASYVISRIFAHLDKTKRINGGKMARLEVFYLDLLEYSEYSAHHIMQQLEQSPQFFSDLISAVYHPASPQARTAEVSDEKQKAREKQARVAYKLLHAWNGYPGKNQKHDERDIALKRWCDEALKLVTASDREAIGQQQIGKVLSKVERSEKDGIWPCRVARDFLEEGYTELGRGLEIARFNSRGVVSSSLGAGGKQDRELAIAYQNNADRIRDEYPSTAVMLGNLARTYMRMAEHEDGEAEKYTDP